MGNDEEERPELGVIFDCVTPDIAAAVRAGSQIFYLPFRGQHLQVHQTTAGVLVTVNGLGELDDLFEYVRYDKAGHAESFVHRLVGEWIRKDTRIGQDRASTFRSWGAPGERVAVEHNFDHSRWYVVVDDFVHTHTPDADTEAGRRQQGWDFVERILDVAGVPLQQNPQLHAAAIADRA